MSPVGATGEDWSRGSSLSAAGGQRRLRQSVPGPLGMWAGLGGFGKMELVEVSLLGSGNNWRGHLHLFIQQTLAGQQLKLK